MNEVTKTTILLKLVKKKAKIINKCQKPLNRNTFTMMRKSGKLKWFVKFKIPIVK